MKVYALQTFLQPPILKKNDESSWGEPSYSRDVAEASYAVKLQRLEYAKSFLDAKEFGTVVMKKRKRG